MPEPTRSPALNFENFLGVNTSTTRAGVDDRQAYWLDGFMPLSPRNLRTLWGIGSALYTATGGKTIVCFYFYNIGSNPYVLIFLSDGSAIQVNTATGAATTILSAGTVLSPSIMSIGVSQWGSQYLLIVVNQNNGYWVWDGSLLYTAGTLGPQILLTNSGAAYVSAPSVLFSGGHGTGASATAQVSNGVVTNIALTNPGTGYQVGDQPVITIAGGQRTGSGATLTAVMSSNGGGSGGSVGVASWVFDRQVGSLFLYHINGLNIAGGSGYSQYAQAQWNFNSSTGVFIVNNQIQTPALSLGITGGSIASCGITPPVNGAADNVYWQTTISNSFPNITVSDAGGAFVSSVTVVSAGSNYSPSTTVTAGGGNAPITQATLKPVITGGSIASVIVQNGGLYTGTSPAATVSVVDTAITATATCTIMPFGVQGTAIEAYQGHVWVFNGTLKQWSAPGSISDFSTAAGGGSETSSSGAQRVGYINAVSTNGFLFEISDSSMDYISGVQTTTPSGGSPTTTFSENNSDPEIGSPYPAAITTFGQEIFLANSAGIFVSSGGAFVKISEAMDGVYNTVPAANFNANPFNGFQLSAAKATIFGKRIWMVLVPIIDPVSGSTVNKILMVRDKKIWWAAQQDVSLTFIQGQEINSIYTAWGTDGTHLYQLFNQPSTAFTKLAQSKYWDDPGLEFSKIESRFWSMWNCLNTSSTGITLTVDTVGFDSSGSQNTNSTTYSLTGPAATGYFITPAQAVAGQGVLRGMTLSTSGSDMTLIAAKIDAGGTNASPVQYRG